MMVVTKSEKKSISYGFYFISALTANMELASHPFIEHIRCALGFLNCVR